MEYLVIALLLAVIMIFLKFALFNGNSSRKNGSESGRNNPEAIIIPETQKSSKFCPLCGSALNKGENVYSKVYPAGDKDQLMEVFGCPRCRPPEGKEKRTCPVCRKTLPENGYLIGRYFVKPGKRHLHVLGCTLCRKV